MKTFGLIMTKEGDQPSRFRIRRANEGFSQSEIIILLREWLRRAEENMNKSHFGDA